MSSVETSLTDHEFKNRKSGLILFGIIHLGLGCLCVLLVLMMTISIVATLKIETPASEQLNPRMMLPGLLFYVGIAVWLIWVGVGSILARRWARVLILITSWLSMISGILGMAMMWFIMPQVYAQAGETPGLPAGFHQIILYVTMGMMAVLFILLPGIMILFYKSPHVKLTCQYYNPKPSWTDRCPLSVFMAALLFGFWAICMPSIGVYGWTLPFFGVLLSGWSGAIVSVLLMLTMAYIAWGSYKLNKRAWVCSIVVVTAWALSIAITFSRVSLMDYYEKMNLPQAQLDSLEPFCATSQPLFIGMGLIWVALILGLLLYNRKFYTDSGVMARR